MNHWVPLIGLVAAGIGVTTSMPQVWRLWRGRHAHGMSYASAVLGFLATSTWLTYGVLIVDPAQMIANVPGLAGALSILVLVLRRGGLPGRPALLTASTWAALVAGLYTLGGPTAVGFAATSVTVVARCPQVWTAFRAPSLAALSPASFALSAVSSSLWMTYGFGTDDVPVWASSISAVSMSCLILARYRYATTRVTVAEPVVAGAFATA